MAFKGIPKGMYRMKTASTALLLALVLAAACKGQQESANPADVSPGRGSSSIALSAPHASPAGQRFDLVSPAGFDSLLAILSQGGIAVEKNSVAAMGFSREAGRDSTHTLFIITLDGQGLPHRAEYALPLSPGQNAGPSPRISASAQPATKLRQDGRVYFMINCAVKSLFVYPSALNMAFPSASGQVLGGVSLLALGGSLYGSYAYTRRMELGYGRVEMMNYGGDLGAAYPLLAAAFGEASFGYRLGDRFRGWGMMLGFPLGIFAGSRVKFAGNFDYGGASMMTSESKFGFLYGYLIPLYFYDMSSPEYLSLSSGLTMALIPAGFYVGKLLADYRRPSSGRSAFITTSAVMGAVTGALIPTLWEDRRKELYATTTLAGHVLGTIYGFTYMGDREYSFGQSMFMVASAAVGGAVCEAVPLIAQSSDHRFYTGVGIAGSWGGLMLGELLARKLFEKSGRDNPKTASVTFPGLWELPLIWACSQGKTKTGMNVSVPLLEVAF